MPDKWCQDNPEECRKAKARWRAKNRARLRKYAAEYADKYREENPDKVSEQNARWYQKNKEYKLSWHLEYKKRKYKQDIQFRLRTLIRQRFHQALKGNQKVSSAITDWGCTVEELRQYLEDKFQPGMSWDNHGAWHIDHIIPLSAFDLTKKTECKKACHFSNLQPLWAEDNLRKAASV